MGIAFGDRGATRLGESVETALNPLEPAIYVSQKDLRCVWDVLFQVSRPSGTFRESNSASEGLLPIGSHDWSSGYPAEHWIAGSALVLEQETGPALQIRARPIRSRGDQQLHNSYWTDSDEAKAEQPAELSRSVITLSHSAQSNREPDLVSCTHPIDSLEHQLEGEGELQLPDDHHPAVIANPHEIASAYFALHLKAKAFEVVLDRSIEVDLLKLLGGRAHERGHLRRPLGATSSHGTSKRMSDEPRASFT